MGSEAHLHELNISQIQFGNGAALSRISFQLSIRGSQGWSAAELCEATTHSTVHQQAPSPATCGKTGSWLLPSHSFHSEAAQTFGNDLAVYESKLSILCPVPGSVHAQGGQGLEHPDLVEGYFLLQHSL